MKSSRRHTGESRYPGFLARAALLWTLQFWIPACAGMTINTRCTFHFGFSLGCPTAIQSGRRLVKNSALLSLFTQGNGITVSGYSGKYSPGEHHAAPGWRKDLKNWPGAHHGVRNSACGLEFRCFGFAQNDTPLKRDCPDCSPTTAAGMTLPGYN